MHNILIANTLGVNKHYGLFLRFSSTDIVFVYFLFYWQKLSSI